ncbi:hypothetical protein [Sorangium cellulosum]|uniref:Secreted protein n=1 Tax=Sorangium cellulosum TaxID=56 RepID=A0A150PYW4_SORCE|nr:hypothetical protein [Sorangium cellulosum]KYF60558.1 hypothetical protein BE15_12515 [Sorangium cellulosum]
MSVERARPPGRPLARPLAALALALLGCGGAPGAAQPTAWNAAPDGQEGASSGTQAERYFPLIDGHVYHYVTLSDGGEQGMLVARVHRADERRGELRFPSGVKRFEFTAEGVLRSDAGVFVLKAPIAPGTTWTGEHGGRARITAVDAAVEVPAGRFTGCVQTVEERLGDSPARYVSTFCPDVGVVAIEAESGASHEKAVLKSYAPPFDMGPDGVRRTPVEPPPGAASPP